ncbi:alpha/beta fold hydrolase [Kitasatospora sp. NPDC058965]|uniref:alpha/beta fold hydrolase n=1 Tax=Kitasatospora sp. NPDC058965 TaxID=3346682 RepID=UPI003698A2AE
MSTEQRERAGAEPDEGGRGGADGRPPGLWRTRSVEVPGALLSVTGPTADASAGLPEVLFVHGLGGSAENWTELMADLDGVVRGEALDLPGFGWSAPPLDGNLSVSGHVRAVIGYLEATGRGPVHLIGNSLGGAVSVRLAALRPDLVRSLTLISPALPELPPQRSALPTGMLAIPGVPRLLSRIPSGGRSVEQATDGLLDLVYGNAREIPADKRDRAVAEYKRRMGLPYAMQVLVGSARGIVSAYTERGDQALWRQAERVEVPVLLVYGLRDKLVSYRSAARACAAFKDARLLVIPATGHVAMMEHPAQVGRAVREFLDEVGGAAGEARRA